MANGPENCDCFYCDVKEIGKGQAPCEYADHHCETCHEKNTCTDDGCLKEFKQTYTPV